MTNCNPWNWNKSWLEGSKSVLPLKKTVFFRENLKKESPGPKTQYFVSKKWQQCLEFRSLSFLLSGG